MCAGSINAAEFCHLFHQHLDIDGNSCWVVLQLEPDLAKWCILLNEVGMKAIPRCDIFLEIVSAFRGSYPMF